MTTNFEKPGTLSRPGPIGRVVRIILGTTAIYFLLDVVASYTGIVRIGLPRSLMLFFGIAITFYYLPDVINIGFTRNWGRKPQLVVIILGAGAVIYDQINYGRYWGLTVGLLVFLMMFYVLAHLGLSLILAGILATPG